MSNTATIIVNIRPYEIEKGEAVLLDAVVSGLRAGGYSDINQTCLAIEIIDGPENTPAILLPGFVGFAKKVLSTHQDFGFFADLNNSFYRSLVIASSGNLTAVQSEDKGTVFFNGEGFLPLAMAEVERVVQTGVRHGIHQAFMDMHADDLTEYFLNPEID